MTVVTRTPRHKLRSLLLLGAAFGALAASPAMAGISTIDTNGPYNASALNGGTITFQGGTLNIDAPTSLAQPFVIANGNNPGGTVNTLGNAVTFSGIIASNNTANGLLLTSTGGTSAVTLTGANTYYGITEIHGVTLLAGAATTFSSNSVVQLDNVANTSLNLGGFNQSIGGLQGGGTTGGNVNLGGNQLTVLQNGLNSTFAGTITGTNTGSLVLGSGVGSGSLTLTGTNNYGGGTTIYNGYALQLGSGGTTGSITGNVINNGTLTFNRSDVVTFSGNITGLGGLNQSGTGTLILTGNGNIYSGATTIANGSTLQIGNGGNIGSVLNTSSFTDSGSLVFDGSSNVTYSGTITGIGSVTQAGSGTLTLTGASGYSGTTTVSAGILEIASGGSIGTNGGGAATLAGGTLQVDSGATVNTAVTGNTGSLAMTGGTINGNVTFSAGTANFSASGGTINGIVSLGSGVNTISGTAVVGNGVGNYVAVGGNTLTITGGTLPGGLSIGNGGTVNVNSGGGSSITGAVTAGGAGFGTINLNTNWTPASTIGGNGSAIGSMVVANNSTLTLGQTDYINSLSVGAGSSVALTTNGALTGNISGAGSVGLTGGSETGTINLSAGAGSYTQSSGTVSGLVTLGSGTNTISGGTASGGVAAGANTLAFSGGNINNGVTLTSGTLNATGGTLTGGITASGAANVNESGSTIDTLILSNSGTLTVTGGTISGQVTLGSGSNVFINSGGTSTFTASSSIVGSASGKGTVTVDTSWTPPAAILGSSVDPLAAVVLANSGTTLTQGNAIYANALTVATGTVLTETVSSKISGTLTTSGTVNLAGNTLTVGGLTTGGANTVTTTIANGSMGQFATSGAVNFANPTTVTLTTSAVTPANSILGRENFVLVANTGAAATNLGNVSLTGTPGGSLVTWSVVDAAAAGINGQTSWSGATINAHDVVINEAVLSDWTQTGHDTLTANTVDAANSVGGPTQVSRALLALNGAPAVNNAGYQLNPVINRGDVVGAHQAVNQVLDIIGRHSADVAGTSARAASQSGISSGDTTHGLATWAQAFGYYGDQSNRDGIDGFTASTGGGAVGGDARVAAGLRMGLAAAYAKTTISDNGRGNGNSTGINSYLGSLYANYLGGPWYLNAAVTGGRHQYDTTRNVSFSGFADTATGRHDGTQYTGKLDGGYPLAVGSAVLTPTLGLQYSHLNQNGYAETSSAGSALSVQGSSVNSVQSSVGGSAATSYVAGSTRITPDVHVAWVHEFITGAVNTTAQFVAGGSSFTVTGTPAQAERGLVGVGLTLVTTSDLTLTANYNVDVATGYVGQEGSLQARLRF